MCVWCNETAILNVWCKPKPFPPQNLGLEQMDRNKHKGEYERACFSLLKSLGNLTFRQESRSQTQGQISARMVKKQVNVLQWPSQNPGLSLLICGTD